MIRVAGEKKILTNKDDKLENDPHKDAQVSVSIHFLGANCIPQLAWIF